MQIQSKVVFFFFLEYSHGVSIIAKILFENTAISPKGNPVSLGGRPSPSNLQLRAITQLLSPSADLPALGRS